MEIMTAKRAIKIDGEDGRRSKRQEMEGTMLGWRPEVGEGRQGKGSQRREKITQ